MALTLQRYKKEFVSLFEELSTHKRRSIIFSDWLDYASLWIHQLPYNVGELPIDADYRRLEQRYMEEFVGRYDKETLIKFALLLRIAVSAIHEYQTDFLGQVFMQEGLWSRWYGQHFTPPDVANLIAQLSLRSDPEAIEQLRKHIERHSVLQIHEPTCGGGSLIIAFAEQIQYLGYDPRVVLQFHAIDIDRDCFHMCYFQLAALGLQAVVYHGNTITLDITEHRPTPGLRYYRRWLANKIAKFEQTPFGSACRKFLDLERQHREQLPLTVSKTAAQPARSATQVATQDVPALPVIETPPYIKSASGDNLVQLSIFFNPATGAKLL